MLYVNEDEFGLLARIRVLSDYHEMNEVFALTSMTIHIMQPDQNLYHLGGKPVSFSSSSTPSLLKTKGQEWLEHNQYEDLQLEVWAVDLSMLYVNEDEFGLLARIRVLSDYHEMNEVFALTSMTIHIMQPDQNLYHLGGKPVSFSSSSRDTQVSMTQ